MSLLSLVKWSFSGMTLKRCHSPLSLPPKKSPNSCVIQCSIWYPNRTPLADRTTGLWNCRPIWGPGIINTHHGGAFEVGSVRDDVGPPPIHLPPIQSNMFLPHIPREMVFLCYAICLLPQGSPCAAPIWACYVKRQASWAMAGACSTARRNCGHGLLKSGQAMTLLVSSPVVVLRNGEFSIPNLNSRIRSAQRGQGWPICWDLTEHGAIDSRKFLRPWLGQVRDFSVEVNQLHHYLPAAPPTVSSPNLSLPNTHTTIALVHPLHPTLGLDDVATPAGGSLIDDSTGAAAAQQYDRVVAPPPQCLNRPISTFFRDLMILMITSMRSCCR